MNVSNPVPLDKSHNTKIFDCGEEALNHYLRLHALQNNQNRSARTYVAPIEARVVGYYTLASGSVSKAEVPPRAAQGLGNYPVPVTLLARLAVDLSEKGKGLGRGLLKDALLRAYQASDIVGSRAVVSHAKDDNARAFYEKFGFAPSPIHSLHLYLLIKDVRRTLES